MITLGFDTSAAHVAAALHCEGRALPARAEMMARGQAEALFPLINDVLDEAGLTLDDLGAIGVGIGPGNFTGIRISVAAARGLALGLGIPAIGISSFDAATGGRDIVSAIPGPRDHSYLSVPGKPPELVPNADIAAAARLPLSEDHARMIAKLACLRAQDPKTDLSARPAPLYIKAADAAPARDTPPRIIS